MPKAEQQSPRFTVIPSTGGRPAIIYDRGVYCAKIDSAPFRTDEQATAIANGFASSSELLAACMRMVRAHDERWNTAKMDFKPIDDARAAIAKATGKG